MLNLETVSFRMAVLCFLVLFSLMGLTALIIALGIYRRLASKTDSGHCCGHCGTIIRGDPIKEIAMENESLLVFQCPKCEKETCLPA